MKKILQTALFAVLVVLSYGASSSVNPRSIIKKGTKLIYDVNYMGSSYEFTITLRDHADAYTFDWVMSAPANKKGAVNVSKEAIQNATGIFNYFTSGTEDMADQCCIILSSKMYNSFRDNIPIEIYTDKKNNELSIFGNPYDHTQSFGFNDDYSSEFDCRTVSNGSDYQITYVDDPEFPLIVEMNLGWSMKLRNILN